MQKRLKFTFIFTTEVLIAICILSTLYFFFGSYNKLKEKNCRQLDVILNQPLISP